MRSFLRFLRAPESETSAPAGDGQAPAPESKPPEPKPAAAPKAEKPRSAEAAVVDEVAGLKKTVKELGEHVGFGKPPATSSATPPAKPWWDPFGAF